MRLLHSTRSHFPRSLLLIGSLCLAVAGCASKNPLMDDAPATGAKTTLADPAKTAAATSPDDTTGTKTSGPTGMRRVLGIFSPYKIEVQQGNFVSKEMIAQIREGMTRDQVRFVLGTPMLSDIFHDDRWYYPFRIQKGNGEVTASRVTMYFKGDLLDRFEGGNLPTEQDYLARIADSASKNMPPAAPTAPTATHSGAH